ncbi:MAG: universal stress protein [Myxococcota bacterium]
MKIFQAIDVRSPTAESEVLQGANWAKSFGATLDLGFVDDYEYSAFRIRDGRIRDKVVAQWQEVQESHRNELERLVDTLPQEVRGEARYLQGSPAPTLLGLDPGYDVLIVATQGRKGLAHAFLGSVAERVVRESAVPVLVLRRPGVEADDGNAGT